MREVWFIRHGESEGNIGLRTKNHEKIPLTQNGNSQAVDVSHKVITQPDLITHSGFLRAFQTAKPTIGKYPDIPVIVLKTHEFTYLEPEKWNGTTSEERKDAVREYWDRADPYYKDGPGAESFAEFCQRGREVEQFFVENQYNFVTSFSHALYIKMQMMLSTGVDLVSSRGMKLFKEDCSQNPIPNTGIFKAIVENNSLKFQL